MKIKKCLEDIRHQYIGILSENLTGIYLHGSLAFHCFQWERSDIDFIAVVKQEPELPKKIRIIDFLLEMEPVPSKGIEMSIVEEKHCKDFTYPTPYVLHYSELYRQEAAEDPEEYCRRMNGEDPDLAGHFTVINKAGVTLYGLPKEEVFGDVPYSCYLDSIWRDIRDSLERIGEDPVYYVLNLARGLAAASQGEVLSKEQGGAWAIRHLPVCYRPLLKTALKAYKGSEEGVFDKEKLREYAGYVLKRYHSYS